MSKVSKSHKPKRNKKIEEEDEYDDSEENYNYKKYRYHKNSITPENSSSESESEEKYQKPKYKKNPLPPSNNSNVSKLSLALKRNSKVDFRSRRKTDFNSFRLNQFSKKFNRNNGNFDKDDHRRNKSDESSESDEKKYNKKKINNEIKNEFEEKNEEQENSNSENEEEKKSNSSFKKRKSISSSKPQKKVESEDENQFSIEEDDTENYNSKYRKNNIKKHIKRNSVEMNIKYTDKYTPINSHYYITNKNNNNPQKNLKKPKKSIPLPPPSKYSIPQDYSKLKYDPNATNDKSKYGRKVLINTGGITFNENDNKIINKNYNINYDNKISNISKKAIEVNEPAKVVKFQKYTTANKPEIQEHSTIIDFVVKPDFDDPNYDEDEPEEGYVEYGTSIITHPTEITETITTRVREFIEGEDKPIYDSNEEEVKRNIMRK